LTHHVFDRFEIQSFNVKLVKCCSWDNIVVCFTSASSIQLCGDCSKWHSVSNGSDWWSYDACRTATKTALETGLDAVDKGTSVFI